jgi:release factor glutamine methyltransferase
MTVAELLAEATAALPSRPGLANPGREARFLLGRLLGRPESWLLAHGDEDLPGRSARLFRDWVARRAAGEPAHAIVGTCPFWGREFRVTEAVLIPRPETEHIVERALRLPLPPRPRVLDVGTGSGCLAVTLALELGEAEVAATDRSFAAVAVARSNADVLAAKVRLTAGNLAEHLRGRFHLLVANLPYVPSTELSGLEPEVRNHEPRAALDGGPQGTDLLLPLVRSLPRLLAPSGFALLELGPEQAAAIADEAARCGLVEIERVLDAGGVERVLILRAIPSSGPHP